LKMAQRHDSCNLEDGTKTVFIQLKMRRRHCSYNPEDASHVTVLSAPAYKRARQSG
jgi:hypothetical protein